MAWEENSRIYLHMQLIAILSRTGVANESFSKDSQVTLDYQGLNYELIPQQNGNFSTMQSSENEIF